MNKQLRNFFNENGYVIINNLMDPKLLDHKLHNIYKVFLRFQTPQSRLSKLATPWTSPLLDQEIIKFRENDPELFGGFYDSLQSSVALSRIVTSNHLVKWVAYLLGIEPFEISSTAKQVRVDVPHDTRNTLQWHQEWGYHPANYLGQTSLTCWLPLVELTDKSGYLEVYAKSHLERAVGLVARKWTNNDDSEDTNYQDYLTTEQNYLEEDVNLDKYEFVKVKMNVGDVLFFDHFLFHRSGYNESDRVRFSCTNRFHGATSQDFIPFRDIPKNNPYVESLVLTSQLNDKSIQPEE